MPQGGGGGGGLTTLSPNQGRFALIKVKSPTSPQGGGGGGGGGGVSRNNDRRITGLTAYPYIHMLFKIILVPKVHPR